MSKWQLGLMGFCWGVFMMLAFSAWEIFVNGAQPDATFWITMIVVWSLGGLLFSVLFARRIAKQNQPEK